MTIAVAVLSVVLVAVLYRQILIQRRMEALSLALRRAAPEDRHVGGETLRFPVDLPGRLLVEGEEEEVQVLDLSASGAQIACERGLEIGSVVRLTLVSRDGERVCDARVIRALAGSRWGLRFNKPSPGFLAAIHLLRGEALGDWRGGA
ncbi:MAG: PilZ domain-containing protein [Deltaproteobacteria bacterium]|nr:PilZ domain-containing protein [Deltaproteobacteria bacterium]